MSKERFGRRLKIGDRFKLHPDCIPEGEESPVFEVVRVSESSAAVRQLGKLHVVIEDQEGGQPIADFWKSGRTTTISPYASVILLTDDESTS